MGFPEGLDFDPYKPAAGEKKYPAGLDFDPYTDAPTAEPSYLDAIKYYGKAGLRGALRTWEIPARALYPESEYGKIHPMSEALRPSEEEEQKASQFTIPQQFVGGLAGMPGAALKYMPMMAAGPIAGPAIAGLTGGAEEYQEGKPVSDILRRGGEEAATMGVFGALGRPALTAAEVAAGKIPLAPFERMIGKQIGHLGRAGIGAGAFGLPALAEGGPRNAIAPAATGALLFGLTGKAGAPPAGGPEPMGREPLQIPTIPESRYQMGTPGYPPDVGTPGVPIQSNWGRNIPMDMVWNAERGRFEPGDQFQTTAMGPRPEPQVPAQLPYLRGLPESATDLHRGIEPMGGPQPDWMREGRDQPPPKYPPTIFEPKGPQVGPEAFKPPPPATTPSGEVMAPGKAVAPATDRQMTTVREQADKIGGGLTIDLIKRWTGLGTKRSNAILEGLVNSGEVEATPPGIPYPWRFKGTGFPEQTDSGFDSGFIKGSPKDKLAREFNDAINKKFPDNEVERELHNKISGLYFAIEKGQPGKRIFIDAGRAGEGTNLDVIGEPSTYPKFISEGMEREVRKKGGKGETVWKKDTIGREEALRAIEKGFRGEKLGSKEEDIWVKAKVEAKKAVQESKAQDDWDRETYEKLLKDKTIVDEDKRNALTERLSEHIMGLKEELSETYSDKEIDEAIGKATTTLTREGTPPDAQRIEQEIRSLLTPKVKIPKVEGLKYIGKDTVPPEINLEPNHHFNITEEAATKAGVPDAAGATITTTDISPENLKGAMKDKIEQFRKPGEAAPTLRDLIKSVGIPKLNEKIIWRGREGVVDSAPSYALGTIRILDPIQGRVTVKISELERPEAKTAPALSATAKDQFALPGIKQGLEMGGAKEGAAPTLEGTALGEAARKAEVEKAQPGLFSKEGGQNEPTPQSGAVEIGKPLWEMTWDEFRDPKIGGTLGRFKEIIEEAARKGEPVPAENLEHLDIKTLRELSGAKGKKSLKELAAVLSDKLASKPKLDVKPSGDVGYSAGGKFSEIPKPEPEPKAEPKATAKAEDLGLANVKDQQRYIKSAEDITKGAYKGKVRVTLTDGTTARVDKSDIVRMPKSKGEAKPEARTGEAPKEPLNRESVQAFANERLKTLNNAPETEILDTIGDIPERLSRQLDENMRDGIKGVYDPMSKKIYLVRDMLGSEEDVLKTIAHEAVGHYATEAFLGKESDPFYNRVYLKYGRSGLKGIAEERGFDLNTSEGRINAAKEKIAQLAETNENPGLLKQFYAWIRTQLSKVFPDLKITDAEIQNTISKARQSMVSGDFAGREAKIDALKRQVKAITGLSPEERFQPAQFSLAGKAKETGKAAYEEEVKPAARGLRESWEWLKNHIAPTVGVDLKSMDIMMRLLGNREKANTRVEFQTEAGVKAINKLSPQEQIDLIDKVQGNRFNELPENLKEYARLHRATEDSLFDKANTVLSKMDKPSVIAYLEGHVRNFWKVVPRGLEDEIQRKGFEGLPRRPLEGTRAPLHHQYWTLKEGMENGGVPFTTNLLEATRLNYADTYKLLTAHDMWNAFGETGLRKFTKFGEVIPEGFRPIEDRIANKYFPPKEGGRWVVEENVGRLLENYLSRDLVRENPFLNGIMGIKNVTTALELGFSAFHLSFETFEAAASQIGLGMRKVWNQGMISEGLKDILTAPKAGYDLFKMGNDFYRLMRNPDEFIKTTRGEKFLKMFPEAKDDIGWLFWGGGSMRMSESYRINSLNTFRENINSKNYIGAALRSIPALSQVLMKPLFESYIPAIKRAQFLKEFNFRKMDQAADLLSGKTTKAEMARETWRSVENRFGEMHFDNLWWNRTMKSGLQMLVRSVTWKLGNITEYGKGVTGQSAEFMSALKEGRMPKLTQEMAWVWGVASLTAAMASIAQYAFTGKSPESWKDLVYPQVDNQGGRLSLPTYMRDLFHATHSPVKYVGSSMAGWFGRFTDILNNKDFYGVQVHDPSENVIQKRVDDLVHLTPLPFSIQSMKRFREEGQSVSRQVAGFLGATKAPYWIERTDAEQKASDLKAAHLPIGGRTAADFERGTLLKNYARRYQEAFLKGEPTDKIVGELHKDIREGKLHVEDLLRFRQRISKEPLIQSVMNLPFRDILDVWNVASKGERQKLLPILMRKYGGLRSPEDRALYLQKISQIREEMGG